MIAKVLVTIAMGAVVAAQNHHEHDHGRAYSTQRIVLHYTDAPVHDEAIHHGHHEDHHAHHGDYHHGRYQTVHHGHPVEHHYGYHEAIHHKHHVEHHGYHHGHHTQQHGHNEPHGHASSSQSLEQHHEGQTKHVEYHGHPKYDLKDPHAEDHKYQHEAGHGDVGKGVYKLIQPDGTVKIVQYYADKKSGLNAKAKYQVHADHIFPEHQLHHR